MRFQYTYMALHLNEPNNEQKKNIIKERKNKTKLLG